MNDRMCICMCTIIYCVVFAAREGWGHVCLGLRGLSARLLLTHDKYGVDGLRECNLCFAYCVSVVTGFCCSCIQCFFFRLCCECGTPISPNPAAMCVACLRSRVSVTEGLMKQGALYFCKGCERYCMCVDVCMCSRHPMKSKLVLLYKIVMAIVQYT